MFNSAHDQYPYFTYNQEGFPSDEDQVTFVDSYIEEFKANSEYLGEDVTTEKLIQLYGQKSLLENQK